jgi:prepilin signal peptidase PulO-like enzyme (type II secretory pathway)
MYYGVLLGGVFGVLILVVRGYRSGLVIPFGPFLILGSFVGILF